MVGSDTECMKYSYNDPDYCSHSFQDGQLNTFYDDDYYYPIKETVTIPSAAGHTFDFKVEQDFYDDDFTFENITYYDHMFTGNLTITINGGDAGESWAHDVDDSVDSHIWYYDYDMKKYVLHLNNEYDTLLVLRMECSESCICTFQELGDTSRYGIP